MKKIRILSLILIVALSLTCLLSLSGCSILEDLGEVYLKKADIVVEIKENGDMEVTERWDVVVEDDDIRNLYRTVNLYKEVGDPATLTNISVIDNDTGKVMTEVVLNRDPANNSQDKHLYPNRFYTYSRGGGEVELGFFIPVAHEEERSYTLRYTVNNAVTVYNDCAELYYQPYSDEFSLAIKEISAKIILPGGVTTSDTLAWLHTETLESSYSVNDADVTFGATSFYTGDMFEMRTLFPTSMVSGSPNRVYEDKRESIVVQETAWYEEHLERLETERVLTIVFTVIGGLLVLLGAFSIYYFKKIYVKVKGEYPLIVREIPEGERPAQMAHFFYHYEWGTAKKKNRGNMLSATILDLTRRGYLALEPDPEDKDDYKIRVLDVYKVMKRVLEPYELSIFNLLEEVYGYYECRPFTMKEFKRYARANAVRVNDAINYFLKESGSLKRSKNYVINKGITPSRVAELAVFCLIAGMFLFLAVDYATFLGAGMFIFAILLIIGRPSAKKLNLDGEAKYMEAKGLEAFMRDFTNLAEHEIPKMILWEEYMVFATMMGISEKVLEALKLKYPELLEPQNVTEDFYRTNSYLYFYVRMNNYGGDLGTNMNGAFNSVAQSVHSIVSASKVQSAGSKIGSSFGRSGGGFRGGGGGSFGGGGGAR